MVLSKVSAQGKGMIICFFPPYLLKYYPLLSTRAAVQTLCSFAFAFDHWVLIKFSFSFLFLNPSHQSKEPKDVSKTIATLVMEGRRRGLSLVGDSIKNNLPTSMLQLLGLDSQPCWRPSP